MISSDVKKIEKVFDSFWNKGLELNILIIIKIKI